ncbi:response regulator [Lignipirellula cremea]|uniref:Sporulation initiation phosphotransferase F n=1 Tax=Lignipirellula cremea TaxID=2528010 RepID=A0A518DUY6_9BACT|nr:response regulator [Lignipirellula cremea]QDU95646.1 Sporulation initiation phosphotransferase F [Lignipirellula cremea]
MVLEYPCLLITDDDRDLRETLQEVFQPLGFRTILAANGAEAVEIVRREPVHLALLDLHMPKLSGLEAIRRVKELQSRLPCILMSAALDEDIKEEAKRAQVFSVHAKPISFRDITSVVNDAMWQTYQWS